MRRGLRLASAWSATRALLALVVLATFGGILEARAQAGIPPSYWLPELIRFRDKVDELNKFQVVERISTEFRYALDSADQTALTTLAKQCQKLTAGCKVADAKIFLDKLLAIFNNPAFDPLDGFFYHMLFPAMDTKPVAPMANAMLYRYSTVMTLDEINHFRDAQMHCEDPAAAPAGINCKALAGFVNATRKRIRDEYLFLQEHTYGAEIGFRGLLTHEQLTLGPIFNPKNYFENNSEGACRETPHPDYRLPDENRAYVECYHYARSAVYAITAPTMLCAHACEKLIGTAKTDCQTSCDKFIAAEAATLVGECESPPELKIEPVAKIKPGVRPNCLINLYKNLLVTKPWLTVKGPYPWKNEWKDPGLCTPDTISAFNVTQCACTNLLEAEKRSCKTNCVSTLKSIETECAAWIAMRRVDANGPLHQAEDCRFAPLWDQSSSCISSLYAQIQKKPWLNGSYKPPARAVCLFEERDYNNAQVERQNADRAYRRKSQGAYENELRLRERKLLLVVRKVADESGRITEIFLKLGLSGLQGLINKLTCADPRFQTFCRRNRAEFTRIARQYGKALGKRNGLMLQLIETEKVYFRRITNAYKRALTKFNTVDSRIRKETEKYVVFRTCFCKDLTGLNKDDCEKAAAKLVAPNLPEAPRLPSEFAIINLDNCFDFSKIPVIGTFLDKALPAPLCSGKLFV